MCMYLDKKATREFRAKIRAAGGTITCWKVYRPWRRWLRSLIYSSARISPGDIASDRTHRVIGRDALDEQSRFCTVVSRGIHVYRTRSAARRYWFERRVVVPVRCRLKDCVGAGNTGDAVFTKVHLSKRSFNAAMKGASDG